MNAIVAEGLSKRFGGIIAVDSVSFRVRCGEIFGFLGPNGAGKTTTVRMLTGVIKPDSGDAWVMGHDVVRETLKVKEVIGVVPETANAYPDLTAWQNLMLIASLYGIPRRESERRAVSLMKEFGIYERRSSKVKGFSKGMKQRLMLCMALVNDPDVLFLDEPTSGLDVHSARTIRQRIKELKEDGKTVFLTSHNMQEVSELCDRVGIINKGKIVTVDSPENLRIKIGGSLTVEVEFDKTVRNLNLHAERVGRVYRIYTTEPHDVILSIVDFATQNNLKIMRLNVQPPSLEDIFVKLTESSADN